MNLRDRITDKVIEYTIREIVEKNRISPILSSVGADTEAAVDQSFNGNDIPKIKYRSLTSASEHNKNLSNIIKMTSALSGATLDLYDEHKKINMAYQSLYKRLNGIMPDINDAVDRLLNYSCYKIGVGFKNQTAESLVGRIGKFITLPFFINSVEMYSGDVQMYAVSTDNVTFSNLESVNSIPFSVAPAVKIQSKNKVVSFTLQANIDTIMANAIYFKMANEVQSIKTRLYYDGREMHSSSSTSNEVLINFNPAQFNSISFDIKISNPNSDKPLSVQMDKLEVFKNIQFAKYGAFESKVTKIENFHNVSGISMSYTDTEATSTTELDQLVSISTTEDMIGFNRVGKDEVVDISLYKYKYCDKFVVEDMNESQILGVNLDKLNLNNLAPSAEDIQFRAAKIIYGVNGSLFSQDTIDTAQRFENWTLSGNYWKTFLLNYEDGVYVNVGERSIAINGITKTGVVKIPVGISEVSIHIKDIDFECGSMLEADNTENPYNFAYLLTGVPDYDSISGTAMPTRVKSFDLIRGNTIALSESFMPLTESVVDSDGVYYDLVLTRTPGVEGSYTIEPYTGRIKVNPRSGAKSITVEYMKAAPNRRPAGVLFNRLLTFASPSSLASQGFDNTLFTLDGSDENKYIILPKIETVKKSFVMYNTSLENMFISTKIKLLSSNKYITPVVSDINLSVK